MLYSATYLTALASDANEERIPAVIQHHDRFETDATLEEWFARSSDLIERPWTCPLILLW